MAKRRTKASAAAALQALDELIQAGDWEVARESVLGLFKQHPTTPGVIERSMHVLRQLQQWQPLIDLLLEARNRYQLWPDGSDLLIGQSLVEWTLGSGGPYLQLAIDQPEHAPWAHHFLGKALRHRPFEEALTLSGRLWRCCRISPGPPSKLLSCSWSCSSRAWRCWSCRKHGAATAARMQ